MHHALRSVASAALVAVALLMIAAPLEARPTAPKGIDANVATPQVFRYRFTPGRTDSYSTVMGQSIKMDAGGALPPVNSESIIRAGLLMKTESVDPDGAATLMTSYENLKLEITQNGARVPAEQVTPLEDMLRNITSRSKMTARGEPRDVAFEGEKEGMKQLTESMKNALVGTTPIFPDKGLKPGESWTQKVPVTLAQGPLKLTINFTVTYTFLGFVKLKEVKTAVFRTDVESSMNETPAGPGGAKLVMTGNGKGLGFLYFDNEKGRMVKSEVEMVQNTNMTVDGGQGTNTIKMMQTTNATLDLK